MEFFVLVSKQFKGIFILPIILLFLGCQKEVKMDIPGFEKKLVVDGRIETGLPPFIFLSSSRNIFDDNSLDSIFGSYINDAIITISSGNNFDTLQKICTSDLPKGFENIGPYLFGIPSYYVSKFDFCVYTTLNPVFYGKEETEYTINIFYKNKKYTAHTSIPKSIPLDSVYWKPEKSTIDYGFAYGKLSDPITLGNAYFWEVLRLKKGSDSTNIDKRFYKPRVPVFDDQIFNGQTINFWYENPRTSFDKTIPDKIKGLYQRGDTLIIKFSTLDKSSFKYYKNKYSQVNIGGNPFASPINIPSNVSGGALGVFGGFSTSYKTLICDDKKK